MDFSTFLWFIVISGFIHVYEEYKYNWIEWANSYIKGVTKLHFIIVNFLFITLCILAALINQYNLIFSLSIVCLVFINAWIHIIPALKNKQYIPGLVSAIVLYLPLSIFTFIFSLYNFNLNSTTIFWAIVIGYLWMLGPFTFQFLRIKLKK